MAMSNLSVKIGLFYFAAYSAYACFFPFLTLYFQERGLSFTEIGIAYAFISIISIIAQPIWGVVTDKYFSKKPVLIALMGICAILIQSFVFADTFFTVLLSIILIIIFQDSISPIADAYAYDIIEHHKNMQFGRIRLMGSAGWSISALILGYVIKGYGMNTAFYIYSACMVVGVLLIYSINFSSKTMREKVRLSDIANLVKEYRFILIMVSLGVANIAIGCNNSFLPVLIEKTGGDVAKLGLMQFLIALSELPIFFYGTRFVKKFGELNLYLLSMVLFFIRFFLNSFCSSYEQVILVQMLQCVTFTLYLLASVEYVNNITLPKMRTSAMAFYAATTYLGQLLGNLGGGVLLEHIDIFLFFKILSLACLISAFITIALKYAERQAASRSSEPGNIDNPKEVS